MCVHLKFADGSTAIVCGVEKPQYCVKCARPSVALCDWKMRTHPSGTCDAPICAAHAEQVARGKHLCPEHQIAYAAWKRRHPPAQGELFSEDCRSSASPTQPTQSTGLEASDLR